MKPWILTAAAGVVFGTGMVAGKLLWHKALQNEEGQAAGTRATARNGTGKEAGAPGPSPRDWERQSNLFSRHRALHALLERSTAAGCRQLLEGADPADERTVTDIVRRWATLDPHDCFAYLTGEGKPCWRYPSAVRELFAVWTKDDPESAWQAANSPPFEGSPKERDYLTRHLIGNLLYHDAEKAMAFVAESRSIGHGLEWRHYGDWSKDDPAEAAELILALPRCNFKSSAARVLAEGWGRSSPEAALNFAEGLEPVIRNLAMDNVIRGWIASDLSAARTYIDSADAETKARIGPSMAAELAKEDPIMAMKWVEENLAAEAWAKSQVALVQSGMADHAEASAAIAVKMPAGKFRQQAVAAAAQGWVESDAGAAREWLATLPPGSLREAAKQGLGQARIPESEREALLQNLDGAKVPEE